MIRKARFLMKLSRRHPNGLLLTMNKRRLRINYRRPLETACIVRGNVPSDGDERGRLAPFFVRSFLYQNRRRAFSNSNHPTFTVHLPVGTQALPGSQSGVLRHRQERTK